MPDNCITTLKNHKKISKRYSNSKAKLKTVQTEFDTRICKETYKDLSIYCAGSLARGDIGEHSDLDIFMFTDDSINEVKKVDKIILFNEVILINANQDFPDFSNDAQYLKIYSFPRMIKALGSPTDDVKNLFTARMLLLLESKPLFNEDQYNKQVNQILEHYFRDKRGKKSFRPMFLLNDILRFWRTLCLNYELIRDDPDRPWRKKNINLKFSRMLSVFGTVLPLIAKPASTADDVLHLVNMTPLERLAHGVDLLNDSTLTKEFLVYLDNYENFLSMKEGLKNETVLNDEELGKASRKMGDESSMFLHKCLTHNSIEDELRKYLVL